MVALSPLQQAREDEIRAKRLECEDCRMYGSLCAKHSHNCPGCGSSDTRMHNGEEWCWACDPDEDPEALRVLQDQDEAAHDTTDPFYHDGYEDLR